jgi:hypothetical protein
MIKLISTLANPIKLQAQTKSLRLKGSMAISLLVFGLCLVTTDRAFARDVCKNVNIKIQNGTADVVKVTKFEYFDFDKNKFRTENLLGLNGQEKLNSNKSFSITRNLQQVGNDKTKFRVTYQHQQGGIKFESPVSVTTAAFICKDGSSHPVLLNK